MCGRLSGRRRHIFQIHTTKMNMAEDVNLEEFVMSKAAQTSECMRMDANECE